MNAGARPPAIEPTPELVAALGWLIEAAAGNPDPSLVSPAGWMPVSYGAVIHEAGTKSLHQPVGWKEALQGRLMPRPWAELDLAAAPSAVQVTYRAARALHQVGRRLRKRPGRVKRVMFAKKIHGKRLQQGRRRSLSDYVAKL